MSVPAETSRWSPRRWMMTIVLVFLLQAGAVWFLADGGEVIVGRVESRPFQIRQPPSGENPELGALMTLIDPTRLVLPGMDGFSGRAWLTPPPFTHQSPGWSSPPEWLRFDPATLLVDLARFGETNHPPRASVAEPLTRQANPSAPLDPVLIPAPRTRFSLTGDVNRDALRAAPEFPVIAHAGVLEPTVLQLDIDERGRVFSLVLRDSSGNPAADQLALKLARALVFEVRPGFDPFTDAGDFDRLRRAMLSIQWWTNPPPATNAPAAAPVVQPLP